MSKEFSLSPLHISYQVQGICFLIGWIEMELGMHNFRRCCCLVLLVTKRAHVLSWIVTPPKFMCTGIYIYIYKTFGNEIFVNVSKSNEVVLINSESVSHLIESKSLDPMNCSRPDSSILRVLPSRILEWIAIPFSRGFSQSRDWTWIPCIGCRVFINWATR